MAELEARRPGTLAKIMAVLLLLVGLGLLIPGVWLVALGGSPYYGIAGVGLLLTGYLLFRGEASALWV